MLSFEITFLGLATLCSLLELVSVRFAVDSWVFSIAVDSQIVHW